MPVDSPRFWSVETPNLYPLHSEVIDGDAPRTRWNTTFGIRTIAYDADRGFLLNGRQVKMRGVNLHHEAGALGAAVPERVWERRLERSRRWARTPSAPRTIRRRRSSSICAIVWAFSSWTRSFDEWTFGKVPEGYHKYFAEWSERDVTDFVRRDRNHPSIVLWSAGNEIGEQTAPDGARCSGA